VTPPILRRQDPPVTPRRRSAETEPPAAFEWNEYDSFFNRTTAAESPSRPISSFLNRPTAETYRPRTYSFDRTAEYRPPITSSFNRNAARSNYRPESQEMRAGSKYRSESQENTDEGKYNNILLKFSQYFLVFF
jgi:hypothetical protein